MKTELTTDQLIASLDKEALREVLVTLVTFLSFEIPDRVREDAIFYFEGDYDKLKAVLEADETVMRDANSMACELNER